MPAFVDPVSTVHTFAYTLLSADASLDALVGDNIVPLRADIDDGARFVAYSVSFASPQYYVGDYRAKEDAILDVDIVGGVDDDDDDIGPIVVLVRNLLHAANDATVIHCKHTDSFNVPWLAGDRAYPRRTLRFKVLVK
jgi:hypothetical protein